MQLGQVSCDHQVKESLTCVADHIAVDLYATGRYAGLTLHMPAPWSTSPPMFTASSSQRDAGRTANELHGQFSSKTGKHSLEEIDATRARGATLVNHKGFFARNIHVAKSDCISALAWGPEFGSAPRKGGTYDTWKKAATAQHIFISLDALAL